VRPWVFPKETKLEKLWGLRVMNIADHCLSPSLDGCGRSIAEIARIDQL
jgi:hypothetical protein